MHKELDFDLLLTNAICDYRAKYGKYKIAYKNMLDSQFIDDNGEPYCSYSYDKYKEEVEHLDFELKLAKRGIEELKRRHYDKNNR